MDWNKLIIGRRVCKADSPEGSYFDIFPFGYFLMLRRKSPDRAYLQNIKAGFPSFRAVMVGDWLVFLSRLGMTSWQASVFHIAQAQHKAPPCPWSGRGLPLHIVCVDAVSGHLLCKRIVEMDPDLSLRLYQLLREQDPADPLLNRDITVRRIFQKYKPAQLAALSQMKERLTP